MLNTSIIALDNIGLAGVQLVVGITDGKRGLDLPTGPSPDFVVVGNVEYLSPMSQGYYQYSMEPRPAALLQDAGANAPAPNAANAKNPALYHSPYFYKSCPQYTTLTAANIVRVKDHGAKGGGATDDTAAIAAALALATLATTDNLVYFPQGSYIITSTVVVPPNARLTGQV